ncbi:MAG: aminotransferase class V-fold PLP-dependent enzyme [Clostridia bacterium]|nr:aminotransferase class V-fold PLP-dependent enzyme [Clostridia bacterium]
MRTVYLDNAATTFPKPAPVLRELNRCVRTYCGNPGRSSHSLSLASADKIYETRELVARLCNISAPEHICFTQNATHALNIAIKGAINHKCHVITSDIEHNALIRPLSAVCRRYGVTVSRFDSDIPPEKAIPPLVRPDTELIVTTVASNVTGKVIDTEGLYRVGRELGLPIIIDASQYLGHKELNLERTPFDVVCAPGHKALFGIAGSGVVIFSGLFALDTLIEGGSGSDTYNTEMPALLPERHEAGTVATPAIVSLGEGVRYILEYGISEVEQRLSYLTELAKERLNALSGVQLLGAGNGIISFNVRDLPSDRVAGTLGEYGICVRGGLHCAPDTHKKLGTEKIGAVRASLSILNTERDIDALFSALKKI